MSVAIDLVLEERKRQDEKWGTDRNLADELWLTILAEEVGESAEAMLKDLPSKIKEVTQVAAVALAWLECIVHDAEQRIGAGGGQERQSLFCPLCGSMRRLDDDGILRACKNCGDASREASEYMRAG